ncbi:hypothetical protein WME94_53955 [Sorangium sp. So ce429]
MTAAGASRASPRAPLVLAPDLPFPALAAALAALGFRRDDAVRPRTPDLVPREPELAAWTLGDGGARVTYTCNPVVSLRVLSPAGVPAEALDRLAARLPHLDLVAVAGLLAEAEPRRVLLGLFAARALGAVALAGRVAALRGHPEPTVARAAEATLGALLPDGEEGARREALRLLQGLCEQAIPVLAALRGPGGPALIQALRPRPEDHARAFVPEVAEGARSAYDELWQAPPRIEPLASGAARVEVVACPAGLLASDNELSQRFPGGYRDLAPYLQPGRVWFVWRYLDPGRIAGMRYDGLTHMGDRWAWFPKPYRVVGELVSGRPPGDAR